MAYQVIARKWRPQTFADVVGQQHIIKTLQSELLQERMAHAYLFVGPRGIGKTTIARIFAKAMNCQNAPVAEPCCECQLCKAITEGNSLDLIEIDGASNNSVEDIRKLREEILYSPVSNKFKVYIIDEVHMLSTSAWNALLKTIEEPPPHAKFLFATTEAHKVLPTVVSRCQRFDLQRITFSLISEQLKKIATSENISIADDAIDVIARAADGGMRDAQSLLDQIRSFASAEQGDITAEQVLTLFGLTGTAEIERLIIAILQNDKSGLIYGIHQLAGQGKNLEKFFEDILFFLRGIQICLIIDDPESILETGDDIIQLYKRAGAMSDANTIQKLLEYLAPVGRSLHDALNKQVFLETILLKGMRIAHAVEIESLITRLNQLRGEDLKALDQIPSMAPVQQSTTEPAPAAALEEKSVQPTEPLQEPAATHIQQTPPKTPPVVPEIIAPVMPEKPIETSTEAVVQPMALQQTDPITPVSEVSTQPTAPPQIPFSPESSQLSSPDDALKKNDESNPVSSEPQQTENSDHPPLLLTPKTPAEIDASTSQAAPLMPEPIYNTQKEEPPAVADQLPDEPEFNPQSQPTSLQPPDESTEKNHEKAVVVLENPKPDPQLLDVKTLSPEAIWHSLILEMDHCRQPMLKAYMQNGKPESLIGGTLTVIYDEDSESFYVTELQKEKHLLELRLKKITGFDGAALNIISKKGVASPHETIHQRVEDMAEVRNRAENNQFIKDTIDLFNGEILDVRG